MLDKTNVNLIFSLTLSRLCPTFEQLKALLTSQLHFDRGKIEMLVFFQTLNKSLIGTWYKMLIRKN